MKFNLFNVTVIGIGVLLIVSGVYRRSPVEITKMTLQGEKITPGPSYLGKEGQFFHKDDKGEFVPDSNTGTPRVVPASSTPTPYVERLPYGV